MKTTIAMGLFVNAACASAPGAIVELTLVARWVAADFDVSSTGTDPSSGVPQENDDLVFGVAPSDGSTTVRLRVNTDSATALYPAGSSGGGLPLHDIIGYTDVEFVGGSHTFGSATWENAGIINLDGIDGLSAKLWLDRDLLSGDPTRVGFRAFGTGDGISSDLFFGSAAVEGITSDFLLWEYYQGEEIRNESGVEAFVPTPGTAGALGFVALSTCSRRRRRSA